MSERTLARDLPLQGYEVHMMEMARRHYWHACRRGDLKQADLCLRLIEIARTRLAREELKDEQPIEELRPEDLLKELSEMKEGT